MKKRLVLLAAAIALSGCNPNAVTNNITAAATPTPTPTPWLTQEPLCGGTITRAEWLVCDNKTLNDLHRRLAAQWQSARVQASEERLIVLEDQLYALLSERTACQDVACVDKAYRRFLDVQPPVAKPPVKPKPKPKPRPRPRWGGGGGAWRDGLQGCNRDIGWDQARVLAQQCISVSRGANSLCSPQRSCATLENVIDKGCRTSRNPPGFCPR